MISAKKMNWVGCPVVTDSNPNPKLTDNEIIEVLIYRACMKGSHNVSPACDIVSVSMYDYLYDLGYKIDHFNTSNGNFYLISW